MTKEEAIHFATCLKNNWTINFADMEDFCDMAIEALQSLSKPNNGLQGSDLISRQDAIDAVIAEGRSVDSRYLEAERIVHESDAVEALSMLPSADRPTGEWVDGDGNNVPLHKDGYPLRSCYCNQCHEWLVGSDEYYTKGNFCPNCGAKMKGGDTE